METPPIEIRLAEPAEREPAGKRIAPATAEVWFVYGSVLDPYGDGPKLEEDNTGRQWFTADPVERIAVHFYDLPEATRAALEAKRQEADREGWKAIFE